MMNYIKLTGVSIVMMIFSLNLTAQTSIDRYFEQYEEDDRFSRVSVSSRMFNLFLELLGSQTHFKDFLQGAVVRFVDKGGCQRG